VTDPCPHAAGCGGCDWPHVRPDSGGPLKALAASEAAARFPEIAEYLLHAPVKISPLAYRLRARLHWDPHHQKLGFYAPRSWDVIAIPSCHILSPRLMAAIDSLTAGLGDSCPEPVDLEWIEDLEGDSAVAALRPARTGQQVISPDWVPSANSVSGVVTGFHQLSRTGQLGRTWGATGVTMRLPVPLEVPVGTFFQGNRHVMRWLFRRVEGLVGPESVATWDLYAGAGLLAAAAHCASQRALQLVEPHRPAARAAQRNLPAARVAIGNTAERYLSRTRDLSTDGIVLTDPPRAGLSQQVRDRLAGWHPDRILMLGCDPSTWARDAGFLTDHGYRIDHIELVDLFPLTHHIEIIALLKAE